MTDDPVVTPHPEGAQIDVWVVPGASRDAIDGTREGALRIRVSAPPEKGRANDAAAGLLQRALSTRRVRLLRGGRSRRKTFVIAGLTPERVRELLSI